MKKVIPHRQRNKIDFRYDIALLMLERKVDIFKYPPVCLPPVSKRFYGLTGHSVGKNNHERGKAQSLLINIR